MYDKKNLVLAVFAVALVSFAFMASAATININISNPIQPVGNNNSNISGVALLNTSIFLPVGVTDSYIGNVSFSYRASGVGAFTTIAIVTNTTANQTTFNTTWDTTAITDGTNYTLNVTAWTYPTNASSANATNFSKSLTIDNTPPTLVVYSGSALTAFSNGTIKNNATLTGSVFPNNLTLNISVSDATVGLLNSSNLFCFANVAGKVNLTAPVLTGGFCNFSDVNITGLSDGNQTINIYINDTLNNVRKNSTLVVQVDTTAPTASASCTKTTVQTSDSFPCTCAETDATSGVSSTSPGGSSTSSDGLSTPSKTGTFTFSCDSTDNGGLTATTSSIVYVVNQPPSSSSSSSSGSSSGSSASAGTVIPSHLFSEVNPGAASVTKYTDPNLGLKEIQINVNNKAQNVKVSVTKYDAKPAAVTVDKIGKVFQYMQIKVDNVAGKLDNAMVQFKVKKTWVSDNGLAKDQVAASKFDETAGKWNELATTYSSEDDTYYYYDATVTSFSYFAIGQKESSTTTQTEEKASPLQNISKTVSGAKTSTWIWIAVIVLIVIVVGYSMRRMKN